MLYLDEIAIYMAFASPAAYVLARALGTFGTRGLT
jgi:hypothetical protein